MEDLKNSKGIDFEYSVYSCMVHVQKKNWDRTEYINLNPI